MEDPVETRFIQSFKSFAAQESFTETQILGRRYRFEDLLSTFLLKVRDYAGGELGELPERVIVGRPVTFAGGAPNEQLALERYEIAFHRMGVKEVLYAYEPVGAAFFFARELKQDATVLVGDFGGGTSDFSIIRFERHGGEMRAIPLGRAGVGVAGDAFDYRIIDNLVSPELGKGSSYETFRQGPADPQPLLLRLRPLGPAGPAARQPRHARDPQAGARGRRAREDRPAGRDPRRELRLPPLPRRLEAEGGAIGPRTPRSSASRPDRSASSRMFPRARFEGWIAPELGQIEAAVDRALADANLPAEGIDRVFLTGGSSLVPAVRAIFHRRFASDRIETGAELESIASGLSLMARERDLGRWTMRAG